MLDAENEETTCAEESRIGVDGRGGDEWRWCGERVE